MQDLRTKQSTIALSLIAQNFKFIIWGDNPEIIKDYALYLNEKNADFQIHWVHKTTELPVILQDFFSLTTIATTQELAKIITFDVVLLAFENMEETNKILSELKAHKILCINLISDINQGNASLPSSFTQDEMKVSVHSNGRTDRKVRALKDYLLRHTEALKEMTLLVIGTDHNLLSLSEREPFHLQSPKYELITEQLSLIAGIQEFFILNTCNRIEVYAIASRSQKTIQVLCKLLNFDHLSEDQYYIKYDTNAFTHMCLVLSGLLSQIPGESHVVQQMKKSIETAKQQKLIGGLIQQIFDNGLFVSKSVRQKTTSMMSQLEIEDLSAKFAHESAKHIENKSILILGAGVVGQGLIERVLVHHPKEIRLIYRTNKPDLSKYKDIKISAHQIAELNNFLPQADTLFSAVSTSRFILHSAHIPFFKKNVPVLIIDICVPRSVDFHIQSECQNVCIADIESLKKWYLGVIINLDAIKKIGLEEITSRIGRYEKILDKEWMQE